MGISNQQIKTPGKQLPAGFKDGVPSIMVVDKENGLIKVEVPFGYNCFSSSEICPKKCDEFVCYNHVLDFHVKAYKGIAEPEKKKTISGSSLVIDIPDCYEIFGEGFRIDSDENVETIIFALSKKK